MDEVSWKLRLFVTRTQKFRTQNYRTQNYKLSSYFRFKSELFSLILYARDCEKIKYSVVPNLPYLK